MGQALARVDLRQYFHHLFTSKDLGAAKPSPEFFRAILAAIGAEPEECIMIGNDYAKDIASAKAVGLRTIWLAKDAALAELFAGGTTQTGLLTSEMISRSRGVGSVSHVDVIIGSMAQLVEAVEYLDIAGK